jgi:hypothetical protein
VGLGGRRDHRMRGTALRTRKAARHGHLDRGPRRPSVASHAAPGEQAARRGQGHRGLAALGPPRAGRAGGPSRANAALRHGRALGRERQGCAPGREPCRGRHGCAPGRELHQHRAPRATVVLGRARGVHRARAACKGPS